jgi:GTP-binding protein Era
MGIWNDSGTQIVFIDTPGFHKPRTKLGAYMEKVVGDAMREVDAVILVTEPLDEPREKERELCARIAAAKTPAVLVSNKTDTALARADCPGHLAYRDLCDFKAVVPVSAIKNDGGVHRKGRAFGLIPEGPQYFPEDMITDQPEQRLAAEMIREKALRLLDEEVPHGVAVEVTRMSDRPDGLMEMQATIYCEKDSHKGIIIGKGGAMLRKIGTLSREEMESFFGTRVYLELWVKVKEGWRDNGRILKDLGFE